MRILISPAKKMRTLAGAVPESEPEYRKESQEILSCLEKLSAEERKTLWKCSGRIAGAAEKQLSEMRHSVRTAAVLAYDGIQYLYMDPESFTPSMKAYIQNHLRILSGFYGVLRPYDGVVPYRLEMQAGLHAGGAKDLYAFWGEKLYRAVHPEDGILINLASEEYSRAVRPYLTGNDRMITCIFGEKKGTKIVQKGVYAKMARGAMVRHLAQTGAESEEALRSFSSLDYRYSPEDSSELEAVFLKRPDHSAGSRPEFEWTEETDGIHG